MRRLIDVLDGRLPQRMGEESGVAAVFMGLLAIPLLGMAALVVDIGLIHAEVRQLQNGADAAALAIAQDCVLGNCDQTAAETTAAVFAEANANDGQSGVVVAFDHYEPDSVTVWASSREADGSNRLSYLFARALGLSEGMYVREATAAYGIFSGGETFPLTFSTCEYDDLEAGGVETILFKQVPSTPADECIGPAGQDFPGGFGWLDIDLDAGKPCEATIYPPNAGGKTGDTRPTPENTTGCTAAFFQSIRETTVLIPVHDFSYGVGSNAYYTIVGFAPFHVTGYKLGGGPEWTYPAGFACPGSPANNCVQGELGVMVDVDQAPTGGPVSDFGAYSVGLIR